MDHKAPIFQNPQAEGGSFYWPGKNEKLPAILLFHGFTATTVEVRPMAKFLNEQGYPVMGPLLPGHGVSPDELNQTRAMDWIMAAEDAYTQISNNHQKVFILGESMGGLLTLCLAATHPEICGILLFAPALKINKLWQTQFFWPFVKYFYKKNIDLSSPWQGFNVVPLHGAAQLNRLQIIVKRKLNLVSQPALIFQGKLDSTIDPISSVKVLEGISSAEKEMIWLEESTHCILLDKQMELVKQLCMSFIDKWSV